MTCKKIFVLSVFVFIFFVTSHAPAKENSPPGGKTEASINTSASEALEIIVKKLKKIRSYSCEVETELNGGSAKMTNSRKFLRPDYHKSETRVLLGEFPYYPGSVTRNIIDGESMWQHFIPAPDFGKDVASDQGIKEEKTRNRIIRMNQEEKINRFRLDELHLSGRSEFEMTHSGLLVHPFSLCSAESLVFQEKNPEEWIFKTRKSDKNPEAPQITMRFGRDDGILREFFLTASDGTIMARMTISNVRINPDLDPSDFQFKKPENVKIYAGVPE